MGGDRREEIVVDGVTVGNYGRMSGRRYVLAIGLFFFLMLRRPPRSTQSRSSAASDVYKRQLCNWRCSHS